MSEIARRSKFRGGVPNLHQEKTQNVVTKTFSSASPVGLLTNFRVVMNLFCLDEIIVALLAVDVGCNVQTTT